MNGPKSRKVKDEESTYAHYREKLGRPDLTREEIEIARANLEAFARAICEHVWGKNFY